jgi:hypothetical protein
MATASVSKGEAIALTGYFAIAYGTSEADRIPVE